MIASLSGPVVALGVDSAVIECGGVGLAVTLTPGAREGLRQGEPARLATHLVVREDSLTLYGFADAVERDVFVTAQSASGVGPKLALALVSALGADGLTKAVANEDIAALVRVPGIGRKGAQKLVIALAGKLAPAGGGRGGLPGSAGGAGASGVSGLSAAAAPVHEALVQLGFTATRAAEALAAVEAEADAPSEAGPLLRAALGRLRTDR
ncbi:MAG: Holliday junction branch migration protein RuvA [Bifidobacteriaceae bacterium]|jgi:Holliday junction DNA helicase RuvA|nr:Holliday junction branch migration protein RuvA [Bifidobacteriaceae bacterium]